MKNQHTPGPWEVIGSNIFYRSGWKDVPIAMPCMNPGVEETKANARLICAAPDLLSALRELIAVFGDHEQYDDESAEVISLARAAIAKAEGME